MQIDVLRNLRNSECQKRDEALNECQKYKKKCEILELENNQLCEESQDLQGNLANTQDSLKKTKSELKSFADQILKVQELLKKNKEEKKVLLDKLTKHEIEIAAQETEIQKMEEALKTTQKNLLNSECNRKAKQAEYDELLREYGKEVEERNLLLQKFDALHEEKIEIENKTVCLENNFSNLILSYEEVKEENEYLKTDIKDVTWRLEEEKRRTWLKNTKELALLSLSALQKIAYVMLPAYLDIPEKRLL